MKPTPTTSSNTSGDLIAGKLVEYQNLPGMVLGLDGWILRSIPEQLRRQFLEGYERLLKIVFHPDRHPQNSPTWHSRQNYLQTVGEAVRFMMSDEFSYEMVTDTVPTRKNPLVTLRNELEAKDKIIMNMEEAIAEPRREAELARKNYERMFRELEQVREEMDLKDKVSHVFRHVLTRLTKQFPVPINFQLYHTKGRELRVEDAVLDSPWFDNLVHFASKGVLTMDSVWMDKWEKEAAEAHLMRKPEAHRFWKGHYASEVMKPSKSRPDRWVKTKVYTSVIGAMTMVHVCEWVRHYAKQIVQKPVTHEVALEAIGYLSEPRTAEYEAPFQTHLSGFMLPFFTPGMLLVLRTGYSSRLYLVEKCDASENPRLTIEKGLEREIERQKDRLQKLREDQFTEIARCEQKDKEARKIVEERLVAEGERRMANRNRLQLELCRLRSLPPGEQGPHLATIELLTQVTAEML